MRCKCLVSFSIFETFTSLDVCLGKGLVGGCLWEREGLVISSLVKEASGFWQGLFLSSSVSLCDKSLNCTSYFVHVSVDALFHNKKG